MVTIVCLLPIIHSDIDITIFMDVSSNPGPGNQSICFERTECFVPKLEEPESLCVRR